MHSLSKKTPTGLGSSASIRTMLIQSTTFRAKRDTLLVMIISIFPLRQSAIMLLNSSR